MNVDPIARIYRLIEYGAFGRKLQQARVQFLKHCSDARSALLLGDGDGRFLAELLRLNGAVRVLSVEQSPAMIALAKRRANNSERVTWQQVDVRHTECPGRYDLVVSHFFFDCFRQQEVENIVLGIRRRCAPGAIWLVTDFALPSSGWRRWHAMLWLAVMYRFFAMTTGLKTNRIPDHGSVLQRAGFRRASVRKRMAGLITSELWKHEAE